MSAAGQGHSSGTTAAEPPDGWGPTAVLPARLSRGLLFGAVLIAVVIGLAVVVAMLLVEREAAAQRAEIEQRLTIQSQRKAEVIEAWLEGLERQSDRITESELFRLFAYEFELAGGTLLALDDPAPGDAQEAAESGEILVSALAEQLPYMSRVLDDFVESARFRYGYLIGRSQKQAFVTSLGAPPLGEEQEALGALAMEQAEARFGAVRQAMAGLVVDFAIPVFAPEGGSTAQEPVAAFLFTAPAGDKLQAILAPDALDPEGEHSRLVQRQETDAVLVDPAARPPLRALGDRGPYGPEGGVAFAQRPSLAAAGAVYSIGAAVPRTPWSTVRELDLAASAGRLATYRDGVILVTALGSALVVAAFVAFWWWLASSHNRALALQFQETVAALVRSIESQDPYLAGHSRRLGGFATDVARRIGAGPSEVTTLGIAANLSQIGKLAVPREILTKPERLTEAERATLRGHVEHAQSVLETIDFGLPVLETIVQMHERIDGAGYPRGLAGEQIRRSAQVLGLCDWFCARVEPRAHRAGMSPEKALEILEQHPERYATGLVAALRQSVEDTTGKRLLAGLP
ncbi:MAG: HD domain-containing protein [Kiloniellales bacterium]|nr:HD domain-containing protein [Kiloniellales bacterium]